MKNLVIILLLVLFALPLAVNADRRSYVWTYQYMTLPEGETELEFYQTTKIKDPLDDWEFRFEVETGLSDRVDFSVYQIFSQTEGEEFKWKAVQFRSRYRIGEEGQYFLDPLLYVEYRRDLDSKAPNKLEAKLILAKTRNKLNFAVNPVYEFFWGPGQEHEIGLDAGISWEFSPRFILGVESTSRRVLEDGEETSSYFGPTVSVASGHWWYTAGVAFGITDDADDARIRFLMGVGL